MTDSNSRASSRISRMIKAPREKIFQAFVDPAALEIWQAPGDMTAKVHEFDGRVGGGYQMSLFYAESVAVDLGKSGGREDRYTARFVELTPPSRIVQAINFDTTEADFAGEMMMTISLEPVDGGTEVTIAFKNLPSGISPEDNDDGTRMSLEKLAKYVES